MMAPIPVERVLVALDASPSSLAALEAAAQLAAWVGAELVGLYVEDESLLRGADLPLTRVVGSFSGQLRPLDRSGIELQLRAQAAKARKAIESVAVRSRLRWTFRVMRGSVAASLHEAASGADILTLGRGRASTRTGRTTSAFLETSGVPVLLLDRPRRCGRAVVTVYDAQPGSDEALELAGTLATGEGTPLTVVLRGGDKALDELEHSLANRLRSQGVQEARFYRLGRGDPSDLARLRAGTGIGMLILPRASALGKGIAEVLRDLGCPVLVIRKSTGSAS
jgi:nucleotide-binding universal stress UspA family protein